MERLKSLEADHSELEFTADAADTVLMIEEELDEVKVAADLFRSEIRLAFKSFQTDIRREVRMYVLQDLKLYI